MANTEQLIVDIKVVLNEQNNKLKELNDRIVSLEKSNNKLANSNNKLKDSKTQLVNQSEKLTKSMGSNITTMASASMGTIALRLGFAGVAASIGLAVKAGFEYAVEMEKLQLALTAVIYATSEITDKNGKALSVQEKNNVAYEMAITQKERLIQLNKETVVGLQDTIRIFNTLTPSLRKTNASYEDLEKLTKTIANSSIAFTGNLQQVLAIIDGIGDGTYRSNSEYGRFLNNLGLSTEKIRELKDVGGDVFGYVFKALEPITANQKRLLDTYSNSLNVFKDTSLQTLGALSEGSKESIKDVLDSLNKQMNGIDFTSLANESKMAWNDLKEVLLVLKEPLSDIASLGSFLFDGLITTSKEAIEGLKEVSGALKFYYEIIGDSLILDKKVLNERLKSREQNKKELEEIKEKNELMEYQNSLLKDVEPVKKRVAEIEKQIKSLKDFGEKNKETEELIKKLNDSLKDDKAQIAYANNFLRIQEAQKDLIKSETELANLKNGLVKETDKEKILSIKSEIIGKEKIVEATKKELEAIKDSTNAYIVAGKVDAEYQEKKKKKIAIQQEEISLLREQISLVKESNDLSLSKTERKNVTSLSNVERDRVKELSKINKEIAEADSVDKVHLEEKKLLINKIYDEKKIAQQNQINEELMVADLNSTKDLNVLKEKLNGGYFKNKQQESINILKLEQQNELATFEGTKEQKIKLQEKQNLQLKELEQSNAKENFIFQTNQENDLKNIKLQISQELNKEKLFLSGNYVKAEADAEMQSLINRQQNELTLFEGTNEQKAALETKFLKEKELLNIQNAEKIKAEEIRIQKEINKLKFDSQSLDIELSNKSNLDKDYEQAKLSLEKRRKDELDNKELTLEERRLLEENFNKEYMLLEKTRIKDLRDAEIDSIEFVNDYKLNKQREAKDELSKYGESGNFLSNAMDMTGAFDSEALAEQLALKEEMINAHYEKLIQAARDRGASEEEIAIMYTQKQKELDDAKNQYSMFTMQSMKAGLEGFKGIMENLTNLVGGENKKMFRVKQGIAIADAIMNTSIAFTKALAEGGPILGPVLAGATAAMGMAQVAQIAAQKPKFHDGGFIKQKGGTNEVDATLQSGEGVLSRRGMSALDKLNRGDSNNSNNSNSSSSKVYMDKDKMIEDILKDRTFRNNVKNISSN